MFRCKLELAHWQTINLATRKEKVSRLVNGKDGVKLVGADKDNFKPLSTVLEVYDCLQNYRSVQSRLWPW